MLRVLNSSSLKIADGVKSETYSKNLLLSYFQKILFSDVKYITYKSSRVVRKEFLDYFTGNLDHTFIPSSPVLPLCDSSVAFTNAGMNQFKSIFLEYYDPPASKVVNYQKCIRVGGKHNDLNMVGLDSNHHTFFEMLGNWSFGAYGKEEACSYAWNMLTNIFGINKNDLYVTYFNGDKTLGMPADLECRDIWLKLGIPSHKIVPRGINDNFWEMGLSGPCGPCTEIHINTTLKSLNQSVKPNIIDDDNWKELWNIVFIENQRQKDGSVVPLTKQYIDTGMGFERLVTILQGKNSNYDTDLFQPLIEAICKKTGAPMYTGKFGSDDECKMDVAYRIIADHARMITVALADGIIPEKKHKLRKIMRKAMIIGSEVFRSDDLLHEMTFHVSENLGDVYPEISNNLNQIQMIVKYEADLLKTLRASSGKFWQSLVQTKPELAAISDPFAPGLVQAYKTLQSALENNRNLTTIPGQLVFKLYDTYGLDLETIEELAQVENLTVDKDGFNTCLENVRIQSRIGIMTTEKMKVFQSVLDSIEKMNLPKTNDSYKYECIYDRNQYQFPPLKSQVVGFLVNGDFTHNIVLNRAELSKNVNIGILLDKTSMYAPEGGQLADKGTITINCLQFNVTQIYKNRGYVIHYGTFDTQNFNEMQIELRSSSEAVVELDSEHRVGLMRSHTATHLLNAALRTLFPVIAQRGSTIKKDNLTFKFSTFGVQILLHHKVSLEKLVNDSIKNNVPVQTKTVNMLQLMAEKNLTLVPGEIYPDTNLRIVEINGKDLKSKEACCGTHIHNTSTLERFCITNIKSNGSANWLITASTGSLAGLTENDKNTSDKYNLHSNLVQSKQNDDWRETVMVFVKSEIDTAINSTDDPFIVHCLESQLEVENIPLQKAVAYCSDMPMFLIAKSNRKFKARCFVPESYLSNSFNAQLWMEEIKKVLPVQFGSFQDENPLMTAHTKILKLPRDQIVSLTENAIKTARKFALVHVKLIKNQNDRFRCK